MTRRYLRHEIYRHALTCLLSLASCLCLAQQDRYALVGGLLLDGTSSPPIRNSIVLINGNRIEAVGTMGRVGVPGDYRIISTEGMTVMPGLWDPHVHTLYNGHPDPGHWFATYADRFATDTMPATAQQFLMAGVTSVRDLAVNTDDILAVRRRIEAGEISGPTIYASGSALIPGPGADRPHVQSVTDVAQAVAQTRKLADAGMEFIKVLGAGDDAQAIFNAIVTTAHAAGVRVTAHGRTDDEIRLALRAGVDEIQHIGVGSAAYPQDILDMIAERIEGGRPLYWCPTIGTLLNADELAADPEWLDDPKNFAGLPEDIERDVRQAIARADFPGLRPNVAEIVRTKLQQLSEAGVIMIFGSDEGTFGHPASESTWRELETWVFEMGMDPQTAIKWATLDSAAYMGMDAVVGSVTPGKLADIIAVRGSPLRHFSTLREPAVVFKNGKRVK